MQLQYRFDWVWYFLVLTPLTDLWPINRRYHLSHTNFRFFFLIAGNICPSPTATVVRSYTTTDASVLTTIAFVSQFDLKCGGSAPAPTTNFYAEVEGRQLNVARSAKTGQYQVSWTEEIPKAQRGDYKINIYDEETFAVVKKVWILKQIKINIKSAAQYDDLYNFVQSIFSG